MSEWWYKLNSKKTNNILHPITELLDERSNNRYITKIY